MRGHPGPPESGTKEPAAAPSDASTAGTVERPSPGGRTRPGGEGLAASERLLRRADYLRCYRTGRRRQGALVALYLIPNQAGHPRIGITTTRKVGNSVVRHRLKRWIKETYRRWPGRSSLAPLDLVAHLKPEARKASFGDVQRDLVGLLQGLAGRRERQKRMGTQG
ncbi:MAG TPA: ribonuclease P protein component [Thermoanaerobaculia bacterium]|nr:ribonuclease P protein component [Thermoanaerobaculia bacterium]